VKATQVDAQTPAKIRPASSISQSPPAINSQQLITPMTSPSSMNGLRRFTRSDQSPRGNRMMSCVSP